jgi:Glycosyl hydrolase family 76
VLGSDDVFRRIAGAGAPGGCQYLAVSLSGAQRQMAMSVDPPRETEPALAELLPRARSARRDVRGDARARGDVARGLGRRAGAAAPLGPVLALLLTGALTLMAIDMPTPALATGADRVASELLAHGMTGTGSAAPAHPSPGLRARAAQPARWVGAHAAARRRTTTRRRSKPALHGNALRAERAFVAMQRYDYIAGSGFYTGDPFATLWGFSQALAATVSLANVPALSHSFRSELHARLVGLHEYLDTTNSGEPEGSFTSTLPAFDGLVAPPSGPGGAKFYDDNDWVGIELMRAYELTHSAGALGLAKAIMAFEMAGWQTNPALGCPGGIPFNNSVDDSSRNAVTDAPGAELGVQLFRVTGEVAYLQFAQMTYAWVRRCLLLPNGLYADNVNRAGKVDHTVWSYNQGTMIGAGTLLYQATGNAEYLAQAREAARAALAYFTSERLAAEIPFFPSVYFRNLLYLDSVTHDPPGAALAQAFAGHAWNNDRLASDLFVWGSPPEAQLLVQASMTQIYALLSTPARTYF